MSNERSTSPTPTSPTRDDENNNHSNNSNNHDKDTTGPPGIMRINSLMHFSSSYNDQGSDNGDDRSIALSATTSTRSRDIPMAERDEIMEIQKQTQNDSANVSYWRTVSIIMLIQTAVAVTLITHQFLKDGEANNAEESFEQFARTIGDAAIAQQVGLRNALNSIATDISLYAETNNNTEWPFVTVPKFEHHARNARDQAKIDFLTYLPLVVGENQKDEYIEHANRDVKGWVEEGHEIHWGSLDYLVDKEMETYHPFISRETKETSYEDDDKFIIIDNSQMLVEDHSGYYTPVWQSSPPPTTYMSINYNIDSDPWFHGLPQVAETLEYEMVTTAAKPVMMKTKTGGELEEYSTILSSPPAPTPTQNQQDDNENDDDNDYYYSNIRIHSVHILPIPLHVDNPSSSSSSYSSSFDEIVGFAAVGTTWDKVFTDVLPPNTKSIYVILENNCDDVYTFDVRGEEVVLLGPTDLHKEKYDKKGIHVNLALHTHPNFTKTEGHCFYDMTIYPTDEFISGHSNSTPLIFAIVMACTFAMIALVFWIYDLFVQKANQNLVITAAKTSAIVTSLFPEHMRERLEGEQSVHTKTNLKNFLATGQGGRAGDAPLADLFLETTIIFADIVGFTAWSSSREPSQVFTLLEKTFQGFDEIAEKHHVFKIETVGDCYVAVTGLPHPRKDHAVLMARFAQGIIQRMQKITRALEKILGPDTTELALRVGIHSGPVTAGVLRGQRARFQLFGDTMNRCARIESSGKPDRVHCSRETAELLRAAGKEAWLEKRADQVRAKGYEGRLETYWVSLGHRKLDALRNSRSVSIRRTGFDPALLGLDAGARRLVDWNVETLSHLIRQMVAHRGNQIDPAPPQRDSSHGQSKVQDGLHPIECVREIIHLPEFNETSRSNIDPSTVKIPKLIKGQLQHLVSRIAAMYNDNPFHNFQHASHVVQSTYKLMTRIVAPSEVEDADDVVQASFDHTYGITGDPLTLFACSFSALIHDVDHSGVPNAQLVKEELPMADKYEGRSVAEQNSLDLSWDLLMSPTYDDLRAYLFPTDADLKRFRQLVVNCVMSTDIADKELKALRNGRWDKAFKTGLDGSERIEEDQRDAVNRKATIVIEHIIQASDISHTMQHWHVYRKWNQKLYEETYVAYLAGRTEKDPAEFWYKGEFGFFDFYIIPLTQKLKECGVFGVSSDECLNYALKNREEWEARGQEVVAEMIEECNQKYGTKHDEEEMVDESAVSENENEVNSKDGDTNDTQKTETDSSNDSQTKFRELFNNESVVQEYGRTGRRSSMPQRKTPKKNVSFCDEPIPAIDDGHARRARRRSFAAPFRMSLSR